MLIECLLNWPIRNCGIFKAVKLICFKNYLLLEDFAIKTIDNNNSKYCQKELVHNCILQQQQQQQQFVFRLIWRFSSQEEWIGTVHRVFEHGDKCDNENHILSHQIPLNNQKLATAIFFVKHLLMITRKFNFRNNSAYRLFLYKLM